MFNSVVKLIELNSKIQINKTFYAQKEVLTLYKSKF